MKNYGKSVCLQKGGDLGNLRRMRRVSRGQQTGEGMGGHGQKQKRTVSSEKVWP